jgi:hypothetical protein
MRRYALACVLAAGLLSPRLVALDALAIQDEWLWLNRAHLYVRAVGAADWTLLHTYPPFSLHPGATLLATAGPVVATYGAAQGLSQSFEAWPSSDQRRAAVATRAALGALHAVLLAALYALLRRTPLFADRPFWAATAVIALGLEPWVLGISRTIHLDTLLTLFLLLAMTASVVARYRKDWRWPAAAGLLWGLAFMTKSPAVNFLPFVLAPLIIRAGMPWSRVSRRLAAWAGGAAAALLVWPPMWFHPLLRLKDILAAMWSHVEQPEVYLWPQPHLPLFMTLLSVPVLLGGILYLLTRAATTLHGPRDDRHLMTDLYMSSGLLFGILLVLAGGDHARKNVPALALLVIPATAGWMLLAERVRFPVHAGATALLAAHLATVAPWFPHVTTYHNALLRSPEGKRLLVDIGNGTRLVAEYFNAREPAVFATNLPGLILPYLPDGRRSAVRRLPKSGDLRELGADVRYLVIPESFPARVPFDPAAQTILASLAGRPREATIAIRDVPLFSIVRVR